MTEPNPGTWAKAPQPADDAERRRRQEETRRDVQAYTLTGFRPHRCDACGHTVLVRKASSRHTSVQWTADAAYGCPERAGRPGGSEGCAKLAESIGEAVRDGRVPIGDGETP